MDKDSKKSWIRIAVFLIGAVLVSIFLPRPDRVSLSYEEGQPWSNDMLIAPFDFPVYRDDATKQRLLDSIDAVFVPVYRIDDSALDKLATVINSSAEIAPDRKSVMMKYLGSIYADGVIDRETAELISSRELSTIKVHSGNVNKPYNTDRLRTSAEAYLKLDSMLGLWNTDLRVTAKKLNLSNYLTPNYVKDDDESQRIYDDMIQPIASATGMIHKGERIINRGDVVTPQMYVILQTYEKEMAKQQSRESSGEFYVVLGQMLFAAMVMAVIYFYMMLFRREVFDRLSRLICLLSLIVGFFIFATFINKQFVSGLYIVPFTILPILLVVFFDRTIAFFSLVMEVILCASFAHYPFEFVTIEIVAGVTAIYSMSELSRRSQLLKTSALVFGAYIVSYAAIEMMQLATLSTFSWRLVGFLAVNMVLTSFAYILIFVVEKVFGFTSNVTLVELADINNPVLRELSVECPGTFQHSMAVSNLATAAAQKVGANVQLVRAGALYHDIGKMKNPAFFTENQHGVNPHDALDPRQSARIIIGHVTDGLRRAEKAKLPKVIRDLIVQHHGKSTARYFYTTYCNAHPGEDVDPTPFTYPGPNPQSKEASLLMMADVVEAASRSLPDHSPEKITALVNRLIDAQVAEGLHKDSPLSFKDITTIKQAFIDSLRTMYHVRVAYPDAKK